MSYVDIMAEAFQDELQKIASAKVVETAKKGLAGLGPGKKVLLTAAGTVGGYELLRRANQDRRLGRQVRLQQQQQGY